MNFARALKRPSSREQIPAAEAIKLHSALLDKLPALPPWVDERRFEAGAAGLYVSDHLDLAHPDNPHLATPYVRGRIAGGARKMWFETRFDWGDAAATFGDEPVQYLRFTTFPQIIQRAA